MGEFAPIPMAKEAKITRVDRMYLRNMREVLLYFSDFAASQELASGSRVGSAPDEPFHGVANKRDGRAMVPFARSKRASGSSSIPIPNDSSHTVQQEPYAFTYAFA